MSDAISAIKKVILLTSLVSFFCLAAQVSNTTPLAVLAIFGLLSFFLPGRCHLSWATCLFLVFFLYHALADYFLFPETSGFAIYRRMLLSFLAGTAMFYAQRRVMADFTMQHSLALLLVIGIGVPVCILTGGTEELFLFDRLRLFYKHPNMLARASAVVFIGGLTILLYRRAGRAEESLPGLLDKILLNKYFILLSMAVSLPVIGLTSSRNALFFALFISGLLFLGYIRRRLGKLATVTLCMLILSAGWMIIRFAPLDKFGLEDNRVIRIMQAAPWKDQTFISRMPIWESAVNAFKQAPLLGNGPESFPDTHAVFVTSNYEYLTRKYGKNLIDTDTKPAPHAHNMYFMQLAESGAVGLLLFLALLLSPLVSSARNRNLYGTIVPILGFMVLVGLFECPFYGNFSAAFNITVTFMCLGYFAAIKGDERHIRKVYCE